MEQEDKWEWSAPSDKDIDEAKRKADKKWGNWTQSQVNHIRIQAKHNLFFLGYGLLGYDKLGKLHEELIKWMKVTETDLYTLALLPRSHYKTTLRTICDPIQIALPDDLGIAQYPRNLGPNVRILLLHEAADTASKLFLFPIQRHFTTNPGLVFFFPECVPNLRKQRFNKQELELPRSAVWGESTFDTFGISGAEQGRHYNILFPDDIFGKEARDSKTVRESIINTVDNFHSLLITPKTDLIRFSGTRWSVDDVWSHIIKNYGSKLKIFHRGVYQDVEQADGTTKKEIIFPEQFDEEAFKILKKNAKIWSAQYLNDPKEGKIEFEPSWLRLYSWKDKLHRKLVVFSGDTSPVEYDVRELDKIILIDPALENGNTGYMITGTNHKRTPDIFTLEAKEEKYRTPDLINKIFSDVMKWQPRLVVIEKVLFSELYENLLMAEMQLRGIRFRVIGHPTKQKAKEERVRGLGHYFAAGQIYFSDDQDQLIEEFRNFGAIEEYHMLDSLAQGISYWKPSINTRVAEENKETEEEFFRQRDPVTGY